MDDSVNTCDDSVNTCDEIIESGVVESAVVIRIGKFPV